MVTWLALLAFLLQGLIVQSHVHIASLEASAPVPQNHQPIQKEPADCPICQLYAATTAVLAPVVPVQFLPLSWVENISLPLIAIAATSNVHQGWQSRAPPVR